MIIELNKNDFERVIQLLDNEIKENKDYVNDIRNKEDYDEVSAWEYTIEADEKLMSKLKEYNEIVVQKLVDDYIENEIDYIKEERCLNDS